MVREVLPPAPPTIAEHLLLMVFLKKTVVHHKRCATAPFFCPGSDSNLNNTSIVILRAAFFRQSLPVMAGFAERLPVILIPEELLITSMRDDVVDDRRFDVPSFLLALDT